MQRWLRATALMLMMASGLAADLDREKAVAEKITKNLKEGEAVWLEAEGGQFFGVFSKGTADKSKGAALLLHDLGGNPDEPGIISALRSQFSRGGWTTLSIQLPLLVPDAAQAAYGATLEEGKKRIAAGVNYLKGQGKLPIVLIGDGFGAALGLLWTASDEKPPVAGLAGVSLRDLDGVEPPQQLLEALGKMTLPLLDIFGGLDGEALYRSAKRAEAARKAKKPSYTQIKVEGADRDFTGMDDILAKRVRGWAEKVLKGASVP